MDRGLTTRPGKKRDPGKPIQKSTLGRILSNPYYVGIVRYEGAEAPGTHERLISDDLFDRVQAVRVAHTNSADKDMKHHHYLKGTLRCGRCGSRMIYTHAKGKLGGIYHYFFCGGRAQKNGCAQPYVREADIEGAVENLLQSVSLDRPAAQALRDRLLARLEKRQASIDKEAIRSARLIVKLDAERSKLVQAHLADAIPVEVLKREQDRLTREIRSARAAIDLGKERLDNEEQVVKLAVLAAEEVGQTYKKAPPKVRRLINQAFFERIYVSSDAVAAADLTEPYAELLSDRTDGVDPFVPVPTAPQPEPVLSGRGSKETNKG